MYLGRPRKARIEDETLLAMLDAEFNAARSSFTEIYGEREKAINYYFGKTESYLPERAKRSKAKTSTVRDSVHNMLGVVMDMYLQTDSPIEFMPETTDDIEQARAETAAVNNIFFTHNNGKKLLRNWFHDAMLQKNGYVKVYVDAHTNREQETYEGYSEQQVQALMGQDDFEIEEVTAMDDGTFNVKGCRESDVNEIKIIPVAPERIVVSVMHNDVCLRDTPYICHYEPVLKSDLVVDGYDKSIVENLPVENSTWLEVAYTNTRIKQQERYMASQGDWARDVVLKYEHYIRADRDGDGETELLQVITAGRRPGKILSIKEVDFIPIESCTPFEVPNSHYGMSIADLVMDKMEITTAIVRGVLDNLNLVMNQQKYVDKTKVQNPQQLINSELGGIVVGSGADGVQPITTPFVALDAIQVMKVFDELEQRSTGLSDATLGLDSQTLAGATNLVGAMTLNQSQLKARMVAGMLAEGVRSVMERIRELLIKYHTDELTLMSGGKPVTVNPRTWRAKRNSRVNVGLGVIQKQAKLAVLDQIMNLQKEIVAMQGGSIQGPFVYPKHIKNSLNEVAAEAGDVTGNKYFGDPADFKPPEDKNPMSDAVEVAGAEVAVKAQDAAAKNQLKAIELRQSHEQKMTELALKARELGIKAHEVGVSTIKTGADIAHMGHTMANPDREGDAKALDEMAKGGDGSKESLNG